VREGDEWVITGEKSMTSLPTVIESLRWGGGWFTITRTGDPALKHKTITDFFVPMKRNGVRDPTISYRPWTEIARRGLDTSVITFNGTRVKDHYRIGEVNGGFRTALWFLVFTVSLGLIFITLGAVLVGIFQILVYSGGAVALLMLVVMFTRRRDETA
jgi:acyl-CoA dehydrogenase